MSPFFESTSLWSVREVDQPMNMTIVMLADISVLAAATQGIAQSNGNGEDETAIRSVIVDMTAGFNNHDPVAASRMYSEDADFTNVAGRQAKGAAEIEKFLAAGFKTRLKAATQETKDVTVRFVRPDVAIVHVTNQISGFLAADGSTVPPHNELSLRVFQKENGAWLVVAFHNTTVATTFKPH
jgi:uncharacterized protein (TIGR02246 family)